ncbi:MAG: NAD(P)-dependent oxidoreductase [Hyphomicrobiaceae bacterium]
MMVQRVGFIGLGDIGMPMARCVIDGGFDVISSANQSREAIETLKTSGLVEADNPCEVAKQADVLISMVVDEAQTDTVLRGEQGALAGLAPGSVIIIMSTISPGYCQMLAEAARVLDCPVSGGRPRAEKGELALICGGDPETVEMCRPVLETMGAIFYCGSVGMGQVAKLANQGLAASQFRLVQEMRAMASAYGMNLDTLMEIVRSSSGASYMAENWEFFEPNWQHMGRMAKKDMDLCIAAAEARNVSVPLVKAAGELTGK